MEIRLAENLVKLIFLILIVIFFAQHVWSHIFHCSNVQWFVFSLFELVIIFDCLISNSNVWLFVFDLLFTVSYEQILANLTVNLSKPNSLLQLLRREVSFTKTEKNKGDSQDRQQKVFRTQVNYFCECPNRLRKSCWWQSLHMQVSERALNCKCCSHHYRQWHY